MNSQPVLTIYVQADIPPGMSCAEYRRRKASASRRRPRLARVLLRRSR
jgi:hypothetical protein